jgi:ADP-heptose:LPS heptosyltransferase
MSQSPSPQRVLFVRLDRIGDLVLTLPVDQSLENIKSSWWIPKGLGFVAACASPVRNAQEVDRAIDFRTFMKYFIELRRERFDAAVVFHAPWWVSLLLWLARIPIRGGVKSQWHSFLFLNRAVRQKRSRAEVSELEYNYRLLERVLGKTEGSLQRGSLQLVGLDGEKRQALLEAHGLKAFEYSIVHPGMGGSALNWPTDHYLALIRALAQNEKVAITGTRADEAYLAPLRAALKDDREVVWLDNRLSGPELITALANARTITAPSTGVLHLAASTGRPTLGIFSPVRVQQPRRWGPQGMRTETLAPQVECPGALSCIGPSCAEHDCMRKIEVTSALTALTRMESRSEV